MKYSAHLDDYPLIVCTNTRRDYAVTVQRGEISDVMASRLIRHVLPVFGRLASEPASELPSTVGIAGCDEDLAKVLAFRVFDVGVFLGRPHTMGLVGILVPRDCSHDWPLSAVLSKLSPPVPDSDRYSLDDWIDGPLTPYLGEPFVQLDQWMAAGHPVPKDRAVCFWSSSKPCPDVLWPANESGSVTVGRSRIRRVALAVVTIGLLVVLGAVLTKSWLDVPPKEAKGKARPRPVLNDGKLRDRLAEALKRSYFIDDFKAQTMADGELKSLSVAAAKQSQGNAERLRNSIRNMKADQTDDIAAVIKDHLGRWETPDVSSTPGPLTPTESEVERALETLNQYGQVFGTATQVFRSPDEKGIQQLLRELNTVAASDHPSH